MTLSEMNFVLPDLFPARAEIFLLIMACGILLLDLFVKSARRTLVFSLTQLSLLACVWITLSGGATGVVYTFSNMFVADALGDFLKILLYLTVFVVLIYARDYMLARAQHAKGEFFTLSLFATLGMMVMISANHFLTLYLGLELLSLALYAMVALNRDSVQATEAAMKYFVLGALASGLLLYGISMIYGATGTLELTGVAHRLGVGAADRLILTLGLVFVVAGIAFKLGVVPFHMWLPDVYQGAPTAVTLFIASAPKLAAFAMLIRLLVNGLLFAVADWQSMLLILAVLSMALGNLAAILQHNLKRMLAYSTISHMGFMLLGMVSGVVGGDLRYALNAYSSALFYVLAYVMTTTAVFGVILLLARSGFEADRLDDFKGLNQRSPWFAAMMMVLMFSMAGIPFFVGFFAKFSVLQAVMVSGNLLLAVIAIVFSLIGAYYYLRVVKLMYFDAPQETAPISAPRSMKVLLSINGLAVVLFGLFPDNLMQLCAAVLIRSL